MGQATYVSPGKMIDYTPAGNVASEAVVVDGDLVGFAKSPILATALGALSTEGIFDIVKKQEAFAIGDKVFWDADGDPYGGSAGTGAATATRGTPVLGLAIAAAGSTAARVRVLVVRDIDAGKIQLTLIPIADLAAGADLADVPIFCSPFGCELIDIGILTTAAVVDVDDGNTVVITVANENDDTIVTVTYDADPGPPDTNYESLGALAAAYKYLAAEEFITLTVTQGATADLPAFYVVIVHKS